ncbi:MAG: drug resistance transporter, EmrB/QacA subfamily [Paenibacillaceae bacterium]|jgi:EmrB/QacA subfamily drug resistance transporter|nr:drug resistance transporter, EmrB/QacA subfamily [Paenibacillaceae bacterium]
MSGSTIKAGETPASIRQILAPLSAIIIGLFMVILDGTAMNVALPGFMNEFQTSFTVVQWTVTGYALAQAAVIPLAGWLSDRFGAKNIFLVSVALFTVGSLLCALAGSIEQLITYRVLQGLGGGMLAPIAMAFTYRLSPPGKVGAVMGMMGIPILLAPAAGPVVAGWLVDYHSWVWIFLINIPVGIIGLLIGFRTLPKIERQSVASLDVLGMLFGPLAFAALSYGVSEGAVSWTSAKTIGGIVIGVVALIAFIIVELNHKNPLLELRVFRSMNFTRGIAVQWVSQISLFGTLFLFPLFLQQAKGYSAFDTGLIMLPQALAAGIAMPIGGKLFDKLGARPLVIAGLSLVTAAAFILSGLQADDGLIMLMLPLVLLGLGMGLSMMPLNTHLIQAAPQNLVSRVTSLTNAAQQVISSFAIAGLATLLAHYMKGYMSNPANTPLQSYAGSFGDTFLILGFISIGGVLLGLLLRREKTSPQTDGSGKKVEVGMMIGH